MSQEIIDILRRSLDNPAILRKALKIVVERRVNARLAANDNADPIMARLARLEAVVERLAEALAERPKREMEIERLGNGMMIVREV